MDNNNKSRYYYNPICKFQNLHDAILKDDVDTVASLLQKYPDFDISQPFDFEDADDMAVTSSKCWKKISLPFHIAVAYCSPKVADLLITQQVNIFATDPNGGCVLHNCIVSGFSCFMLEKSVGSMIKWLNRRINSEAMSKLLHSENKDGFRPLEFAAQQGTLDLMKTILELPQYATLERTKGWNKYTAHDVTEYEFGNRHHKSPINMLAYLDVKKFKDPNFHRLLLDPLIMAWINGKIKSNIIPLCIWIFLRSFFLFFYILVDTDTSRYYELYGSNITEFFCEDILFFHPGKAFTIFTAATTTILCSVILLYDLVIFCKYRIQKQYLKTYNLNGKKNMIANTSFYQYCQFILLVSVGIICGIYIPILTGQKMTQGILLTGITLARIVNPILMLWSICYFTQFLPKIGSRIISLQFMLIDMASFLVVLFLCTLFFLHAFKVFIFANSNSGCIEEFSNIWKTYYTLFRMMINMYDLTVLDVTNVWILQLLHIIYVLFVSILVINFLIAIMSKSASNVAENEEVILKINQIAVVVVLEERIYWMARKLYVKMRRCGFYCRNGRCYIISVVDRNKELFEGKHFDMDI